MHYDIIDTFAIYRQSVNRNLVIFDKFIFISVKKGIPSKFHVQDLLIWISRKSLKITKEEPCFAPSLIFVSKEVYVFYVCPVAISNIICSKRLLLLFNKKSLKEKQLSFLALTLSSCLILSSCDPPTPPRHRVQPSQCFIATTKQTLVKGGFHKERS